MAVSFRRCPTVAPGEPITSTQAAGLCNAINDRARSGLGDFTFRLAWWFMSAFRSIRNPDSGGTLFPPQAEFFEQYQTLEPSVATWPVNLAGEAEGVNVANPLGCFTFGRESADIDAEADRIAIVTALGGVSGGSLPELWQLAKAQRGAIDPSTGAIASPALDTARLHMRIAYSIRAPYGNSYGGYQPIPEIGGTTCAAVDGITPVNYLYKFTNLDDGSEVTYPGSCPEEPSHVAYILAFSDLYIVGLNNGDVDYYRRDEWIEGPYTGGGSLRRAVGGQLDRFVDRYAKDFRGTNAQRSSGRWNEHAFDFQAFLTRQYSLAPQRGHMVGESDIAADYPVFNWETDQTSGTIWGAGIGHTYQPGYVLDSLFLRATNLSAPIAFDLIDTDGTVLVSVSAQPDDAGVAEKIVRLREPVSPQSVRLRLSSSLRFAGGSGTFNVELTELYPYKPSAQDAYLLLRVASAGNLGTIPGSGTEETQAAEVWQTYRDAGVIRPSGDLAAESVTINTNAVFDAARRMSKCVRILSREQLIGYALEDGKSVLYFRRLNRINADSFDGIGPSRYAVASGELQVGLAYSSRSGSVTYNGATYAEGEPFTCVAGVLEYVSAEDVYEHDGIRHTAPRSGWSNEWLVDFAFKAYHPSESSIWKPSAFSDYFAISDRCHFYHPTYVSTLQQHFDYGQSLSLAPEAAPGYRYAQGTNSSVGDVDRYKSCRIYEPPVEVDKAEVLIEGGEEIIKLTLTGRLHYSDDATSTIDRDVSTWDVAALRAEAYRSTENAVREYLVNQYDGTNAVAGKPGDSAVSSGVDGLPDNPYGTVFPSIYFTQLMPLPYDDGNDRQNLADSPLLHDLLTQAELYLRVMCEGFVDGRTSEEYACTSGIASWYDYTFTNLCFDAFEGQWLSPLASVPTDYTGSEDTREDSPQGFGPHPNTKAHAEVFNQFAAAVNLLTRVRVMLPMQFEAETRSETDSGWTTAVGYGSDGTVSDCTAPGNGWYSTVSVPIVTPVTVAVPRTSAITASSTHSVEYSASGGFFACTGPAYDIDRFRQEDDYWLELVDPDAENAIPETWRDQFEADGESLFIVTTTRRYETRTVVDPGSGSDCAATTDAWPTAGGQAWLITYNEEVESSCEVLPMQDTVTLRDLGNVTMYGAFSGGAECYKTTEHNRTIEPVTEDAFILNVPLVDP